MVGAFKPFDSEGTWGVCRRCAEVVLLGQRHDFYECSDNDKIQGRLFKLASKRLKSERTDLPEQQCLWMRGLLPRGMAKMMEGPSIIDAMVWESPGFIDTINRSQFGYCDGSGGQGDIVKLLRPSACGMATFDLIIEGGVPTATNIQVLGAETPGKQTVPRSEFWGGNHPDDQGPR